MVLVYVYCHNCGEILELLMQQLQAGSLEEPKMLLARQQTKLQLLIIIVLACARVHTHTHTHTHATCLIIWVSFDCDIFMPLYTIQMASGYDDTSEVTVALVNFTSKLSDITSQRVKVEIGPSCKADKTNEKENPLFVWLRHLPAPAANLISVALSAVNGDMLLELLCVGAEHLVHTMCDPTGHTETT